MIKKLLPLALLLIGSSAGVGAGIFMRPAPASEISGEDYADSYSDHGNHEGKKQGEKNADDHDGALDAGATEFVKMSNQFVVPIVNNGRVAALVVLGLSIEVPSGDTDVIYQRQPKMRDSFLQVLFDHANMGGFDGAFTDAQMLGQLRDALRDVAQRDIGSETVKDVLIVEIARQDY